MREAPSMCHLHFILRLCIVKHLPCQLVLAFHTSLDYVRLLLLVDYMLLVPKMHPSLVLVLVNLRRPQRDTVTLGALCTYLLCVYRRREEGVVIVRGGTLACELASHETC